MNKLPKWIWIVFLVVVISVPAALFAIRNSDVFQGSLDLVSKNAQVIEAVGEPIQSGWVVAGRIKTSGSTGEASLNYSIKGLKDSGQVEMEAVRAFGKWKYTKIQVLLENSKNVIDVVRT